MISASSAFVDSAHTFLPVVEHSMCGRFYQFKLCKGHNSESDWKKSVKSVDIIPITMKLYTKCTSVVAVVHNEAVPEGDKP